MWLLLLFLAVPILEIALFIQVGGALGLWPTLGLVVLSAVAGASMMRRQGLRTLGRLQSGIEAGEDPTGPIAEGAMLLVAGVLLLTPGFFTDAVGLALLVPAVRSALIRRAADRLRSRRAPFPRGAAGPARRGGAETIEGDYEVLDDVPPSQRGASGWTRPSS